MTKLQFVLLILGLIAPCTYFRVKIELNRKAFYLTPLRDKSKLNIHHGHYGFLLVFAATVLLVCGIRNSFSIGLAGFGWGLMLDEFIPLLKMPSPGGRVVELAVYDRAAKPTIIMIFVIAVLSSLAFMTFR